MASPALVLGLLKVLAEAAVVMTADSGLRVLATAAGVVPRALVLASNSLTVGRDLTDGATGDATCRDSVDLATDNGLGILDLAPVLEELLRLPPSEEGVPELEPVGVALHPEDERRPPDAAKNSALGI
jgi:hypothetical protein